MIRLVILLTKLLNWEDVKAMTFFLTRLQNIEIHEIYIISQIIGKGIERGFIAGQKIHFYGKYGKDI